MDIYSLIENHLVNVMTPVVTLTSIETIAGPPVKYKLYSCNTQWATVNTKIDIDGVIFRVVEFVQDEYLIVTGPSAPVQLYFQLEAPHFEHGAHRRVNNERNKQKVKKNITPMVYMLPVKNTGGKVDSLYPFKGRVRIFFLKSFNKKDQVTDTQQIEVINPMKAMADYFIEKMIERGDIFEETEDVNDFPWMDFGDPEIWGNKEKIFDENLSGVELAFEMKTFTLDEDECCSRVPTVSCLPGKIYLDGDLSDTVGSGQNIEIEIVDQDGNTPVYTYDQPSKKIEVQTGGGSSTAEITNSDNSYNESFDTAGNPFELPDQTLTFYVQGNPTPVGSITYPAMTEPDVTLDF